MAMATARRNRRLQLDGRGLAGGALGTATTINTCGEPSGIAVGRFNADERAQ
jgi:hypothetical protein